MDKKLNNKELDILIANSCENIRIYFNDLNEQQKKSVRQMLNNYIK